MVAMTFSGIVLEGFEIVTVLTNWGLVIYRISVPKSMAKTWFPLQKHVYLSRPSRIFRFRKADVMKITVYYNSKI